MVNDMVEIKRNYKTMCDWDMYATHIDSELQQCIDEGLDIDELKPLFEKIIAMPDCEEKTVAANELFHKLCLVEQRADYKYNEPSDLEGIKALRERSTVLQKKPTQLMLKNKVHGAWLGRVVGCLLGKPVEGVRTEELVPFLKESNNYPMHRYILSSDVPEEVCGKYKKFNFRDKCYADTVDGMPVDDDTNYVVLGQYIVSRFGKNFTPEDVIKTWVEKQSINSYFTAERVAFRNYIDGFEPPYSALYRNPYREWIGAQIRGDYYGYINPGNPEKAAEMAYRDASVSHIKNGIYGEMLVAAMLACAAVSDDILEIIDGGLGQIPATCRLYEAVRTIENKYKSGISAEDCFSYIHSEYDEHTDYGWCHTIPNAMIVVAALLYGENDFGKAVCLAVQTGFDTDCNGATVGSIMGMKNGAFSIGEQWKKPVNNKINTSIFGYEAVYISDCVKKTMEHMGYKDLSLLIGVGGVGSRVGDSAVKHIADGKVFEMPILVNLDEKLPNTENE